MKYRRFTEHELTMFIEYLETKIQTIEGMATLGKDPETIKKVKYMAEGVKAVQLDLKLERKKMYEI